MPQAQSPIPIVTHLHGAEISSVFDGHPEAWFTSNEDKISLFSVIKNNSIFIIMIYSKIELFFSYYTFPV